MQHLTLEQVAAILETATVTTTTDQGHAIVHVGTTETGHPFVLVNDCFGSSVIAYSL